MEGAYDQITHRLGNVEQRLGSIEHKIDSVRDVLLAEMSRRFDKSDQKFNFIYGLIVVSIIIPLIERFIR